MEKINKVTVTLFPNCGEIELIFFFMVSTPEEEIRDFITAYCRKKGYKNQTTETDNLWFDMQEEIEDVSLQEWCSLINKQE